MPNGATQSAGPRIWIVPTCATLGIVAMHMLPGSDVSADDWWALWHMDKWLHALAFAGCGLTWAIALAKQRRLQRTHSFAFTLMGGALIFGTVLEVLQGAWMPGRFFDLADVAADVAGAGLSLVAFQAIFGQKPGRIASD